MNNTTQTVAQMTSAEKGARVRAMNLKWYSDRSRHGMKVADEILEFTFASYLAELERREEGRP